MNRVMTVTGSDSEMLCLKKKREEWTVFKNNIQDYLSHSVVRKVYVDTKVRSVPRFEAYSMCPVPHSGNTHAALCSFGIQVSQCTIMRGASRAFFVCVCPFLHALIPRNSHLSPSV